MAFYFFPLRSSAVFMLMYMASFITINGLPFSKQSEPRRGTFTGATLRRSARNTACLLSVEAESKAKFLAYVNQANIEVIYLHIAFLNVSKEPLFGGDISTIYDPLVWAWSANEEGNAILSLPYDYKVLSCTTLSRETRRVSLRIVSHPPNCLEQMSSEQQFLNIVNLLMETAMVGSVNSSICHRFVDNQYINTRVIYQSKSPRGFPKIKYKCYIVSSHDQYCTMKITPNWALSFILTFLWLVSCVAAFFIPLLIGYLPNGTKMQACEELDCTSQPIEMTSYDNDINGKHDGTLSDKSLPQAVAQNKIKECDYITLNSRTQLLEKILEVSLFLCLGVFPRLSRFLIFFLVIPIFLWVALGLYFFVLGHETTLQNYADLKTDFVQMCLNPDAFLVSRIIFYLMSCILLCVPISLATIVDESVSVVASRNGESVNCCIVCTSLHEQPDDELIGSELLYDNMLRHMKFPFKLQFWKVLFCISSYPARWLLHIFTNGERIPSTQPLWKWEETYFAGQFLCRMILGTAMWLLLFPVWLLAFSCSAFFIIFLTIPIGYFYACICFVPFVYLVQKFGISILTWLAFPVVFILNSLSALFLIEVMTFSCGFILKLIGFTLMGLVVNVDYYIPYVVYILAVTFYIQNFWNTLNDKYLKLKVHLFDECLKQQNIPPAEHMSDTNELVIRNNKTKFPMIPRQLYEKICKEHMPLIKTASSNLFKLLMIILFLSFAFASIMAFGKWAKIPSLTEAIVTALLSTLPKLMRYQGKETGRAMLKQKKLLYSIEVQVEQFARMLKDENPLEQHLQLEP